MRGSLLFVTLGCCWLNAGAQTPDVWTVARTSHFEVYSQTGEKTAREALLWFEQLHAFFGLRGLLISGFTDQGRPPLRIVGFRSAREYADYRLHPLAEAYHASEANRDYIIMGTLEPAEFAVAAHEYAHHVTHVTGLKLPAWLHEGMAEFFSTVQVNASGYSLGGDIPSRTQTLTRNKNKWLSLEDLLNVADDANLSKGRNEAEIFYAESWALVDMLIGSPRYASHFRELVSEFNTNANGAKAFHRVYGRSLEEMRKDFESWVGHRHTPKIILSRPLALDAMQITQLSPREVSSLMAELSLVSGHLEQARTRYEALASEDPHNPNFQAALGTIALRHGNRDDALRRWRNAINDKVNDAQLCFRFASLVEDAGSGGGMTTQDEKVALERAVLLSPGFDDARYRLALLHYRAGEYKSAVESLREMHLPLPESRRYAYWTALASSLVELNENAKAHAAALEAAKAAKNASDKMVALDIAYAAETDLTVQFDTDEHGQSRMVTTRVPHGTVDWNPFIEPSDRLQHANGKLSEVLCLNGKLTGFLLSTSSGPVTLDVADPLHVLMRNSPSEFYCGPAKASDVQADYAVVKTDGKTKNLLRGMTFQH